MIVDQKLLLAGVEEAAGVEQHGEVEAAGVEVEAPGVEVEAPGVEVEAPGVEVEAMEVDAGVKVEAAGVEVEAPGVEVEAMEVDAGVEVEAAGVEVEAAGVEVEEAVVEVEAAGVEVEAGVEAGGDDSDSEDFELWEDPEFLELKDLALAATERSSDLREEYPEGHPILEEADAAAEAAWKAQADYMKRRRLGEVID